MIFVNFKTYRQGTAEEAVKLARICREVSRESSVEIIPLVQAVDIFPLSQAGFEIWAQHVDDIEFGPNTGQVLLEAAMTAGAEGTLLNHSECKLPVEVIGTTIEKLRNLRTKERKNFQVLVCAESVEEGLEIAKFKPDFLAYEPPELIGSRTDSVSKAKPEVIKEFVEKIREIPVLVGAGIHSAEDVKAALKLGAEGILVSSDVVLAEDPKKELEKLVKGFKNQD